MHLNNNKKFNATYLYKKGRKKRLENQIICPSEFFYGYRELLNEGVLNLNFFEELDLDLEFKNIFLKKFLNILTKLIFNFPFNPVLGFLINKSFIKLNDSDYIISTTNTLGIVLSIAKKFNLINAKVFFIYMGLFHHKPNILKIILYRYIFNSITILTISKTENQILNLYFRNKAKYIPFGVDSNFWKPQNKKIKKKYVLAIGNDQARDWETLIKSWDDTFPLLKIVTSLPIKTHKSNIEIIRGNWHAEILSDIQMRDLYNGSEFVIIPLKQTFQPSGQSTCLQAMGCSKAVLISDIKGIWDRELLKHQENIFFVKPEDKKDLNKGIKILINNLKMRSRIEKQGRLLIENHFNVINMKNNLQQILEEN